MICFLLLMLFMPVILIAQEQNNPAILVAKYQKELTNVLISLCSHNYKVELGQLRDKKKYDEREKLGMQETEAFFSGSYSIENFSTGACLKNVLTVAT